MNQSAGTDGQNPSEEMEDYDQEFENLLLNTSKEVIENENEEEEAEDTEYDERDFLKDLDPILLLTSEEAIDCIIEYDSTVHVIGVVTDIEAPIYKGRTLLFKFVVQNNTGQRIQVYAWNDDVQRVVPFIQPNHIIHIDGGFAQGKKPRFSAGNTKMDLTIRGNTKINVLKKIDKCVTEKEAKLITIENIWNEDGLIRIEAHLKAEIKKMRSGFANKYESGCIAQNKYKIEMRIGSSTNTKNIKRGEPIAIVGKVKTENKLPYIMIENYSNITKMEGQNLSEKELMHACIIPKRKINNSDIDPQAKVQYQYKDVYATYIQENEIYVSKIN